MSARRVLPIDSLSKLERGALCKLLLAGGRALYTSNPKPYDALVDGGYAMWSRGHYILDVDNLSAMLRANGLK